MQARNILRAEKWIPVIGIVVLMCNLAASEKVPEDPEKSIRLCGNRLVDAVLEICNNKIYDPRVRRDVDVHDDDGRPSVLSSLNQSQSRFPHLLPRREVMTALRRSTRGIVNECCRNRCTISDLMMYCAVDR